MLQFIFLSEALQFPPLIGALNYPPSCSCLHYSSPARLTFRVWLSKAIPQASWRKRHLPFPEAGGTQGWTSDSESAHQWGVQEDSGPWTTRVWTVGIHLCTDFFFFSKDTIGPPNYRVSHLQIHPTAAWRQYFPSAAGSPQGRRASWVPCSGPFYIRTCGVSWRQPLATEGWL